MTTGFLRGLALLLVLGAATPAAAQWRRLDSPNFVVIGDGSARNLRDVAVELEGFRETLTRVLGARVTAAAVPTIVVVFPTETAIAPFRPKFNGKPVDVAGLFVPGRDLNYIALIDDGRPERLLTIFHEYTHLLISHPDQPLPLWLDEGLAEYYSTFELQRSGREAMLGKVIDDHLIDLNHTILIPLDDLLAMNHDSPLYNEGSRRSVFYAQAWALTHLILLGPPSKLLELNAYLGNLSDGDPPAEAWRKAFGAIEMQKRLAEYIRQRLFLAQKPAFSDAIAKFDAPVTALKPAEVQAHLADLLIQMGDLDAAAARLAQAAKLDAALPALPIEMARLAMARADSKAGRDVHLDGVATPADWLLAYLGGVVEADAALERDGLPPDQTVAAVQRFLRAAGAGHSMFLNAAGRLAEIELRSTAGPAAETAAALADARRLAPTRYQYAFLHAQVLVRRGEFAQARAIIEPFIAGTYASPVRVSARTFMGYIVTAESARARGGAGPAPPALPPGLGTDGSTTPPAPSAPRPVFRELQAGEQRLEGTLTQIECVQGRGITFHVKVGDQDVTTTAPTLTGVSFITYRDDLRGSIQCGPLAAPMAVYVTWKPDPAGAKATVAIEFLPKGGSEPRPARRPVS